MRIFIPAGIKELEEKGEWFLLPACKKAAEKLGVEFGFEVKFRLGDPVEPLNSLEYPYGIHLPNDFSDQWYSDPLKKMVGNIAVAKGSYFVLHGKSVYKHFPSANPCSVNFSNNDWYEALTSMYAVIRMLNDLKLDNVAIENTGLTNFVRKNNEWEPEMYLDARIGGIFYDLFQVKETTNCLIVLDIEHLAFSWNLLMRQANHSDLPRPVMDADEEDSNKNPNRWNFGNVLFERDQPPVFVEPIPFWDMVKLVPAAVYHFAGSVGKSKSGWQEICDGKIASHLPIGRDDFRVKEFLNFALLKSEKEKITIVPEVSGPENPSKWYGARGSESQRESLVNVCEMLLDII